MISYTIFLVVISIVLIAAVIFIKLFADKARETGYRKGQNDRPRTFMNPITQDFLCMIQEERISPINSKDIIPEFGIKVTYENNDTEPLKRMFLINSSVGYTEPLNKSFKLTPEGMSDGWHTFEELYNYRAIYNAGLVNMIVWAKKHTVGPGGFDDIDVIKSLRHFGGEKCYDGKYFVVMIKTPYGQISNHYKLEHWNKFNCRSAKVGWKWDGHTMQESNARLIKLYNYIANGRW